jgi:3-hydroxyisobutyrate dehydrogenase
VFERSPVVILMLVNSAAIDRVLERSTPGFRAMVAGRTIVSMSSVSPEYSRGLEREVKEAGGRFVEAPVSGSRIPAESGQLVAMLAGDEAVVDEIGPLLKPMCHETLFCGPAGSGLLMKLSVNLFMIVMATGLAEAVHFADRQGLDRGLLQAVLNAGPMASNYSRMKLTKLVARDYSAQAAAMDAWTNTGLITDAADRADVSAGLIRQCQDLYQEAVDLGHGSDDLMAVIRAIEARSAALARERE